MSDQYFAFFRLCYLLDLEGARFFFYLFFFLFFAHLSVLRRPELSI